MTRTSWCGQVMAPKLIDLERLRPQRGGQTVRTADDHDIGRRASVACARDVGRPRLAARGVAALVQRDERVAGPERPTMAAAFLGSPILGPSRPGFVDFAHVDVRDARRSRHRLQARVK